MDERPTATFYIMEYPGGRTFLRHRPPVPGARYDPGNVEVECIEVFTAPTLVDAVHYHDAFAEKRRLARMPPRKKHGWPFWFAIAVIVVILYAASFGPACWLMANILPPKAATLVIIAYTPLIILANCTDASHDLLQRYVHLWADNVGVSL